VPIEARLARAGLPPLPRTAWLELDLDALRSNLDSIRGLVGRGVRVEPVVKADAYGHGAVPIARALEAFGADGLWVATYDEAVELRAAGLRLPILVLFPIPPARAADAAAGRISVSIGDSIQLEGLVAAVVGSAQGRDPGSAGARGLDVHLEVETGLGRDGFPVEGIAAAARKISEVPRLHLAGLWTHMQDAADRARTAAQLDRFEAAAAAIRDAGIPLPGRHAAASAGLLARTVMAFDAVRPGLATYGLVPDELLGNGWQAAEAVPPGASPSGALPSLRPVMSLHARPIRVANLPSGWGISYGPAFETARASRIATLPLGYGDGWPRALSDRGDALVRGVRAPLVGNVAMDALMVDVTDVPGDPVSLDDEFVLLGRQGADEITAASLAAARLTISWEVVAAMSRRLPRVYHAASGPLEVRTLTAGGASS
jgi:alanine racemase